MSSVSDTEVEQTVRTILEAAAAADGPGDPMRVALGTVDGVGQPHVRYVLLKSYDARGFVFYTNYGSRKATQLDASGVASLAFHWWETGVQLRARGTVSRIGATESDAYFESRGRNSQLGAWASKQSAPLPSREMLVARVEEARSRFEGGDVPRPEGWGGYRLEPRSMEVWRDAPDRLHSRHEYTRIGDAWRVGMLYP